MWVLVSIGAVFLYAFDPTPPTLDLQLIGTLIAAVAVIIYAVAAHLKLHSRLRNQAWGGVIDTVRVGGQRAVQEPAEQEAELGQVTGRTAGCADPEHATSQQTLQDPTALQADTGQIADRTVGSADPEHATSLQPVEGAD